MGGVDCCIQLKEKRMLKTSEEWQKECTVIILDPDGWDRQNYQHSWYEEKITQSEFEKRMVSSTVKFTKPIFDDKNNINEIWINKRGDNA